MAYPEYGITIADQYGRYVNMNGHCVGQINNNGGVWTLYPCFHDAKGYHMDPAHGVDFTRLINQPDGPEQACRLLGLIE